MGHSAFTLPSLGTEREPRSRADTVTRLLHSPALAVPAVWPQAGDLVPDLNATANVERVHAGLQAQGLSLPIGVTRIHAPRPRRRERNQHDHHTCGGSGAIPPRGCRLHGR